MYRCQLSAKSVLLNSWKLSNHPNLLVCNVYQFHVYFHIRVMFYHLDIPFPRKNGLNKVENSFIKSAYYNICDDFVVNAHEVWMNGDWF